MTQSLPGKFAGKMAFCSAATDGPKFYLTTCEIGDGQHGSKYLPGMNALSVTETEKFILYQRTDGYYCIQSGDLRWLTLSKDQTLIRYGDDPADAAHFLIQGNPFGSQLSVRTQTGDSLVYYMLQDLKQVTNALGVTGGKDHYSAFAPTSITPSLDTIRQQKQAVKYDFTNVIFSGQDLQGINFTEANFKGAKLAGANFTGATLDSANMSQTDLRGLDWGSPASAVKINLSGSNCSGCKLGGQEKPINCTEANLSSANFTGAHLENLNLQNANLGGAILNGAWLDKSALNFANLNGVVALRASFTAAVLTNASAQMAVFTQAVFDNATLTRVKMGASSYHFDIKAQFADELDKNAFPPSDLLSTFKEKGKEIRGDAHIEIVAKGRQWLIHDPAGPYKLLLTDLGIQVFNDSPDLIPAILREASLRQAVAQTASLSGADLRGVRWYAAPATLDHADLEDADLTGALLVSTDFTQANVSGADFSNTILIQGKFTGCVAGPGGSHRAISFEGAHLEGVVFSKATFAGAILTDAIVALESGVPLLVLPLEDQQYLTDQGLSKLAPSFRQAGFDLGKAPASRDNPTWSIDNSKEPQAPQLYNVDKTSSGFRVFGNGQFLFLLPQAAGPQLNQPKASQQLVSMFKNKNYKLALNAPITPQKGWIITPGDDAVYLRPYRFITMKVKVESARLSIFGAAPVLIENLSEYPEGVAFNATQNLENALSPNAIGPAGVPFSWVAQGLMDTETFFTAFSTLWSRLRR